VRDGLTGGAVVAAHGDDARIVAVTHPLLISAYAFLVQHVGYDFYQSMATEGG